MKQRVIVKSNDTVLFDGKLINIPIKEAAIIEKSIELFDDDDPCIIHKSYIAKEYASTILEAFGSNSKIALKDHVSSLSFLDFDSPSTITLELKE
jgi:hypothetical protein